MSAPTIDYAGAADVFWCSSAKRQMPKGSMRFQTFPTLAEAVRFLVTDTTETRFQYAIDTDQGRYEKDEIAALYERPDFPDRPGV
ncbi:hypothetical protein [Aureimonas ureilytica]|uniref:hypothetical protein n=1 Tax=Aureimonas ureilytica TaxID=401562 RepID=UPI0012DDCC61|nr:hypothetical protein [Aureimonas ureilytica]